MDRKIFFDVFFSYLFVSFYLSNFISFFPSLRSSENATLFTLRGRGRGEGEFDEATGVAVCLRVFAQHV